ncbi:hypothetical protein GEV33_005573 [Tenebrio molitor]|uniref:Reverse transcriptase domain-containing protein n=1 Tax=Tenebrio molitor TaxID=7067 RepID=A0A8J6HPD0_TENMO|nr:hypothetical protein GEV33_005573 [Tenebrio molitor]
MSRSVVEVPDVDAIIDTLQPHPVVTSVESRQWFSLPHTTIHLQRTAGVHISPRIDWLSQVNAMLDFDRSILSVEVQGERHADAFVSAIISPVTSIGRMPPPESVTTLSRGNELSCTAYLCSHPTSSSSTNYRAARTNTIPDRVFGLRPQVEKTIRDMERMGVIKRESSHFASPMTVVKKKDGTSYTYQVLPFGLKMAVGSFSGAMDVILSPEVGEYTITYIDDLLIVSSSFEEHLVHLGQVLQRLRNAGTTVNLEKSVFLQEKVDAIQRLPLPKPENSSERFLACAGTIADSAKNSHATAPLTRLLRKDVRWCWATNEHTAFERTKELFLLRYLADRSRKDLGPPSPTNRFRTKPQSLYNRRRKLHENIPTPLPQRLRRFVNVPERALGPRQIYERRGKRYKRWNGRHFSGSRLTFTTESVCNRCWRTRGGRPSGWKIVQEELQPYAAADLGFLHEGQRPYASADLTSPPCWAVVIPQDPNREQDLTPDSPSPSSFQEQILSGKGRGEKGPRGLSRGYGRRNRLAAEEGLGGPSFSSLFPGLFSIDSTPQSRCKELIHRDGNVLGLPPKNLRTEGVEAINRGNQRQNEDFSRPFAGGVGRRDDVVEFTRAVGDDSSKYHRPHRQADHGLHYGRFQTERFCGSGSRRVLSVQVVPGLTGRCRIYPPASPEQW